MLPADIKNHRNRRRRRRRRQEDEGMSARLVAAEGSAEGDAGSELSKKLGGVERISWRKKKMFRFASDLLWQEFSSPPPPLGGDVTHVSSCTNKPFRLLVPGATGRKTKLHNWIGRFEASSSISLYILICWI